MSNMRKAMRIEPAFDDPEQIRALFDRHAPYRTMATYLPRWSAEASSLPYFRGTWAVGGQPLVDGVEPILHNPRFLQATRTLFGTARVHPTFIVVNVNAPMPAGPSHVDIPTFHGATREQYPLPFLNAMGASGLFERWRVLQAGVVAWFYEGPGGHFEYWPEGRNGPMRAERPPFWNVALLTDNDRMYHRIGRVGEPQARLPRMTAAAEIRPVGDGHWAIVEQDEIRATYPSHMIRLSLVWKANLEPETRVAALTLDRVMSIFVTDLRQRGSDFGLPANPLSDQEWSALLEHVYCEWPDSTTLKE
jgi:hypothetical protein